MTVTYPRLTEDHRSLGGKHARYMNRLAEAAYNLSDCGNARHAACIVYKGDVIAYGINERKSHPFQAKYGKNEHSVFLHAETSAIKNALKIISTSELEKSTLYVCRVKWTDFLKREMVFGLSKPCPGCFRCINTFNIKRVIYSLDNHNMAML